MKEYIILRLRLMEGVNKELFRNKYNIDINDRYLVEIEKLKSLALIEENGGNIYLTSKGFDLANQVFVEFI